MSLRPILTKSNKTLVGETVERSVEAALHKSRDEIIHLVPFREWERWYISGGPLTARCGFDCSGRKSKPANAEPLCIVCVDLRRVERGY